jgi:hypothetical protein
MDDHLGGFMDSVIGSGYMSEFSHADDLPRWQRTKYPLSMTLIEVTLIYEGQFSLGRSMTLIYRGTPREDLSTR